MTEGLEKDFQQFDDKKKMGKAKFYPQQQKNNKCVDLFFLYQTSLHHN